MAARATLANQTGKGFRELVGVVVNAGKMDKTVTVRVGGTKWHKGVQKYFKTPQNHLVHDPNNSLRLGDVLSIVPGWRTSRHKRHIVNRMILPAGVPLDKRPPIPTEDERLATREADFMAKKLRKAAAKGTVIEKALQEASERLPREIEAACNKIAHSGVGRMLREKGELEARLEEEDAKMRKKLDRQLAWFRDTDMMAALRYKRGEISNAEWEAKFYESRDKIPPPLRSRQFRIAELGSEVIAAVEVAEKKAAAEQEGVLEVEQAAVEAESESQEVEALGSDTNVEALKAEQVTVENIIETTEVDIADRKSVV